MKPRTLIANIAGLSILIASSFSAAHAQVSSSVAPSAIRIQVQNGDLISRAQRINLVDHEIDTGMDRAVDAEYLVLVGNAPALVDTASDLRGTIYLYQDIQASAQRAHVVDRSGVVARTQRIGQEGAASDLVVNRLARIALGEDSRNALAFFFGGDRLNTDTGVAAVAGSSLQFGLGDVSSELSIGVYGSAPDSFDILRALSNPGQSLVQLPNGFLISSRMQVRIFELPIGTVSAEFRAQIDQLDATTQLSGYFNISIR